MPTDGSRPQPSHTVAVLVAHGSRNPAAQDAHRDLVGAVAAASGTEAREAYLEAAAPSIPEALDGAVADGATRVRVFPCFLHPGNHVQVDLPRLVDEARARHPGVEIELLGHLGADPDLAQMIARRLQATPSRRP